MRDEDQTVEFLERISNDVQAIRKNISRLARESYRQDLARIASTSEREEMWRLLDGTLSTDEVAKKIGVSLRSVQYFAQDAEKAGLLVAVGRGYLKRTDDFDVIPPEWKTYKGGSPAAQEPAQGEGSR